MNKALQRLCALACALSASGLHAQAVVQQVGPVTPGHIAAWWQNGQVYDGGAVPSTNTTNYWTGMQTFGPGTLNGAPVAILPGVAPANLVNGDVWAQSDGIYGRFNGVTQGPYIYSGGSYTWSGKQVFGPGTLSSAPISILPGVAPSSPVNGDVWTTSGQLFLRLNGATISVTPLQATNEAPGGAINGSNVTFTLAHTPINGVIMLYYNGILLEPGAGNDFTLSGTTITMLYALPTGAKLRAYYSY